MTSEQRAKNIRVETEIMGRARTSAVRTPSGDLMTVGQCPRDFCNDLNLCVNVMQPRLEELRLMSAYVDEVDNAWWNTFDGDYNEDFERTMPIEFSLHLSAGARVDAALRALDSVKAGAA